jgi:hypothetical protein
LNRAVPLSLSTKDEAMKVKSNIKAGWGGCGGFWGGC